ncbi:hypothetical protein AMAG_13342 [Allomyces macrogynus ATCC 38327]|uniref:Tyrosinase copper-binding domain-containing protein n=1 Tax=Allomyces macrogynus (strain ATCC 38327) TaxID=578462 RepID=A0A0L0T1I9_ALLM3|nr:hypothetical protein AMAG_13342 [Allomyces macrogynus ATCC 38327]|eukprot:KNE68698.1 hypothetical protein AMAG_13342 [Allomyces macrogynus ATCC 38327]
MKSGRMLSLLALAAVVLLAMAHDATAECGSRRVRKEIHDLTPSEMQSLVNGLKTLYTNGVGKYYVDMHVNMNTDAHNTPQFLPYHRLMVWKFEAELLKVAPGLSGLPYWDASYQASNPASSFVFREDVFGAATNGCLTGSFAGLPSTASGIAGCVKRSPQPNFTLYSPELILGTMTASDSYASFERSLEYGQHASVHNYVAGNMGNVLFSPSDPIFWLHHSAVDYYWAKWQGLNNNANYNKYNGQHKGRDVSPSNVLADQPVSFMLDYWTNMCYQYQDPINAPSGKAPFALGAKGDTPSPTTTGSASPTDTNSSNSTTSGNATATTSGAPSATATPAAQKNITIPSGLTDEFIKQFQLNSTQAARVHDMVVSFVNHLNEQIAAGQKVPTLADLAMLSAGDVGANLPGGANATPTPTAAHSGAGTLTGADVRVGGAVAAVVAMVAGMLL